MMFWKRKYKEKGQFTLVLGGGGARGLSHIGVLTSLEKAGLIPSLIVGTSMGALMGAMYSQLVSAKKVEERMRLFLNGDFFKKIGLEQFSVSNSKDAGSVWERFAAHLRQRYFFSKSVLGTGMFAQTTLLHSLHMLLEEKDIRDLPIRFAAVASDLVTGEEYVFTSGSIITAVAASSAVPGVVAPIVVDSHFLTDGTVTSTIPVPAARTLSKNPVVAVDVRKSLGKFENHRHGYEIVMHAGEITSYRLNDIHLRQADIIISPDVSDIEWNQFRLIDYCINAGKQAAEKQIQRIRNALKRRTLRLIPWL